VSKILFNISFVYCKRDIHFIENCRNYNVLTFKSLLVYEIGGTLDHQGISVQTMDFHGEPLFCSIIFSLFNSEFLNIYAVIH